MSWYVDPGLKVLIDEVKANNPGMTVYTIGDEFHASTVSDHNPDPDGSVDAADFMIRDSFTAQDAENLFQRLRSLMDSRIKYVIYNRRIFSRTVSPWVIRTYTGSNPHTDHVHVSIEDINKSTRPWGVRYREVTFEPLPEKALPVLKYGDIDPIDASGTWHVHRAQRLLQVDDDGIYGELTKAAVRELGINDGTSINMSVWSRICGFRAA